MEDDYKSTSKSRDKKRRQRRATEDEYYYRDTEDTIVRESKYAEEKSERAVSKKDIGDNEESRRSPDATTTRRSRRQKRSSKDKESQRHKSRDRKKSSERKSVHYKEETDYEIKETQVTDKEHRGRSKERSRRKVRDEGVKTEIETENDDEVEYERRDKSSKRKKERRKEKSTERKRKDESENSEIDDKVKEKPRRGRAKERLRSKREIQEHLQREDSLEKTRRDRSKSREKTRRDRSKSKEKETTKQRKSKERTHKAEVVVENEEIIKKEKRRSKSKSRRKHRSKDKVKEVVVTDISFIAPSETYEEMKKTSHDLKFQKPKEKRFSDDNDDTDDVQSESPTVYCGSPTVFRGSPANFNRESPTNYPKAENNVKQRRHKEKKSSRKNESKIKKEIRKKREPRLYYSDSEVEINKTPKNKNKSNNLKEPEQDSETSSVLSVEKPIDMDSLYNLYKDPDPKPLKRQVIIRASSKEKSDSLSKSISIDQTHIRSKLIRVLFQRVKELLKETEDLRSERKDLTTTIELLNEDLISIKKQGEEKFVKEQNIEERLAVLADEMKVTAKGTSFREEIHNILHNIQNKYQIHWREHEHKIQQVQNDAENNIQSLMKNIVGKYVELSELKTRTKSASDIAKLAITKEIQPTVFDGPKQQNDLHSNEKRQIERQLERRAKDDNLFYSIKATAQDKEKQDVIYNLTQPKQQQQQEYQRNMAYNIEQNHDDVTSYRTLANNEQHNINKTKIQNGTKIKPLSYMDEVNNDNDYRQPLLDNHETLQRYMREESNRILKTHTINNDNLLNLKTNQPRLNEPLYIDTQAYSGKQDMYNEEQNYNQTGGERVRRTNKDLLLRIVPQNKNENLENNSTNQYTKQQYLPTMESDEKCAPLQNLRIDPITYNDSDTNSLISEDHKINSQRLYDEAKSYRNNQDRMAPQNQDRLISDENTMYPKFQLENYRPSLSLKMDAKEFWRHKLLQPNSNEVIRRNEHEYNNTTVRNTY